ncbi:hypothetical protein ACNVED_11745 [Legionella sp. D16C41]|uniref:hypothetical protein n=1 Tax=Legionella sp. D16C41 TaxID=3402688 RepID=UPI003AF5C966
MKNSSERALAYQLAKEINYEDLEKVTGGNGYQMTTKATLQPSGSTGQWDTVVDISIDF